jgi:peroxiredoxin Q/BCP
MTHLQVGDKAPQFSAKNCLEQNVNLSDFNKKKLILFFYPKAMTPGCTAETVNLSTHYKLLQEKGFEVLGVSPDTVTKQKRFKEKKEVPFNLIPDENKNIIMKYGIWGPKKLYGRVYDGLHRTTFIIDEDGKIEHIINKVKTKIHTEQILALYNL